MKTLKNIIPTIILMMFIPFIANATEDDKKKEKKDNKPESSLNVTIVDIQHPTCDEIANGMVQVRAEGGVPPYEYNWNTFPNQFDKKATNLSAGIYFVHVTDAMGNKFYKSVELVEGQKKNAVFSPDHSLSEAKELIEIKKAETKGNCVIKLNGKEVSDINSEELEVGIHKMEIIDANKCVTKRYIQISLMEKRDPELATNTESIKTK